MTPTSLNLFHDIEILQELSPPHTYLALSPAGQKLILKRLDSDCLFENQLHVSIKERLQRIQEIPHPGVANLHGVHRAADGSAFLLWEYLHALPLEEYLITPDSRGRLPDLLPVARELVMSVESLSRLGIVHGNLHGGNIFVTRQGSIRLTHLSPYLYTDPAEDARAVIDLLLDSLNKRYQPGDLPTHRLLTRAHEESYDLSRLGPLLACPPDSPLSPMQMSPKLSRKRERRRRSFLIAFFLLILGLLIPLTVLHRLGYISSLDESAHPLWIWLTHLFHQLHQMESNTDSI